MHLCNVTRQQGITSRVGRVEQQEDDVETRQQSSGQVDVLVRLQGLVVATVNRVRRGQNGSARIQRGRDAGLRDRDGLLLHDFVNVGAVTLVHLVELIDAADAVVGEDKGTTLEYDFAGVLVLDDGSGETNARRTLAGRVDASGRERRDMLQELRLCDTRVTHEECVELTANLHAVLHVLGHATNHEQKQGLLDLLHAEDLRTDGVSHAAEQLILAHGRLDLLHLLQHLRRQHKLLEVLLLLLNLVDVDVRLVHEHISTALFVAGLNGGHVDAGDRDNITRRALSRHRASGNQVDGARNVTNGHLVGRLLDLDILVRNELALLDLQVQLALHVILRALEGWAFDLRRELFTMNHLINLVAARLASIDGHLHARLDVAGARDNTLNRNQAADAVRLNLTHGHGCLLGVLTRHDNGCVLTIKFRRESIHLLLLDCHAFLIAHHTITHHVLALHLVVEDSLVAQDVERAHLVVVELDRRWRHLLIDDLSEQLHVASGILPDALNEAEVTLVREVVRQIGQLNFDNLLLSIGDGLETRHVFQLAVNSVVS